MIKKSPNKNILKIMVRYINNIFNFLITILKTVSQYYLFIFSPWHGVLRIEEVKWLEFDGMV